MSEESDDKQFDASESKLRRAREEGDIPRSAELQAALAYLGFWFAVLFAAGWAVPGWVRMAARALGSEPWPDGQGRSVMDLAQAMALLQKHDAISACRLDALNWASKAKTALGNLDVHPLRDILSDLADYVVSRVS